MRVFAFIFWYLNIDGHERALFIKGRKDQPTAIENGDMNKQNIALVVLIDAASVKVCQV